MALRNFIKNGTYTYVEQVSYSKQNKTLQFMLVVKNNDKVILNIPMSISANNQAAIVTKVINDSNEIARIAPEFLDMKPGENYYILVDNPKTDYIRDINGKIISKNENRILPIMPNYYYAVETKEAYKYVETMGYIKLLNNEIETAQQFDNIFDPSNILQSVYKYIKSLPIFANCIDA